MRVVGSALHFNGSGLWNAFEVHFENAFWSIREEEREWMTSCNNNETSTYSSRLWNITGLLMDESQRLWWNILHVIGQIDRQIRQVLMEQAWMKSFSARRLVPPSMWIKKTQGWPWKCSPICWATSHEVFFYPRAVIGEIFGHNWLRS